MTQNQKKVSLQFLPLVNTTPMLLVKRKCENTSMLKEDLIFQSYNSNNSVVVTSMVCPPTHQLKH